MNNMTIRTLEPAEPADAALILMHGLGTTGDTFAPMGRRLQSAVRAPLRIVLPTAPKRPVTLMGGQPATAWFDLRDPDFRLDQDEKGIEAAGQVLASLVQNQIDTGIEPGRITVAGFSQGAALSIRVGTTLPHKLAGIASLSGWFLLPQRTRSEHSAAAAGVPVFVGHGRDDRIAPPSWIRPARTWLEEAGHEVTWHSYPIGHAVNEQEIADLGAWIDQLL